MDCHYNSYTERNTIEVDREIIMTLLEEMRSLKEKYEKGDEANRKILTKLTDEVMGVRKEVKQLRNSVRPEADTRCPPSFPLIELKEIHEKDNEAKSKTLAEEVKALRAEVNQLWSIVRPELDTSLLPTLPFYELGEFQAFDAKLLLEDEIRTQLKIVLQRLGGKDFSSFLRMAIKTIISDELAIHITWRGTNDKPSIQKFAIFSLLKDVCNAKYNDATDVEVNKLFQQHFVHAKDRVSKRRKISNDDPLSL